MPKHNDIISDFYQGTVKLPKESAICMQDDTHGNCASIALIKAALIQFGSLEAIFKQYKKEGGTITVTLRDDLELSIDENEIAITEDQAKFKNKEDSLFLDDAIILYAIMCKRILVKKTEYKHHECIKNFTNAVEYLNSGYKTENVYDILGFEKESIRRRHIKNKKSVVIWTNAHASYCTFGKQDLFGKTRSIKNVLGTRWMRNPAGGWGLIIGSYVLKEN